MNRIATLIKQGWTIDQIYYDRFQKFFYTHATHDSQEASVEGNGHTLTEAMDMLYETAIASTPKWYLENLKAQS